MAASKQEFTSENHFVVTHTVDRGQTGIRLDAFLKDRYRRRSREMLKRAIDSGAITLQRRQGRHLTVGRLKPSSVLVEGDEVLVLSERKPEPEVCFDYKVLFEDDVLMVIEKPANLPVHPAGRYFFNTLLVHLRTQGHRTPLKAEREFFLVHRIDKETSGILVLARDRAVAAHLVKQFAERRTGKRYLALVRGAIDREEFTVDLAMGRARRSRVELKMATVPTEEGGLAALTRFRRVAVYRTERGEFSLVECFPKTGRQHQIRVHLDAVGHPIVGDKLYGIDEVEALNYVERKYLSPEAQARLMLPRHALHAAGIRFTHPLTGKSVEFASDLPHDLKAFVGLSPDHVIPQTPIIDEPGPAVRAIGAEPDAAGYGDDELVLDPDAMAEAPIEETELNEVR